jgi:hypothetical protein
MNKPDLANLYRRFTRNRVPDPALPELDADALVALAEGEHSEQTERLLNDAGRSGLHADMLRFAHALRPESARLGAELEQAFEATAPQHRGAGRATWAAAAPRRPLRIAGALAASLLAAVVVWTYQQKSVTPPAPVASVKAPQEDRIFAALDERSAAGKGADRIFHGGFVGDKIFKFNGG